MIGLQHSIDESLVCVWQVILKKHFNLFLGFEGFAITLGLGIITSVFTAIYVTRLLIVIWFERRRPKKIEV